MNSGNLHYNVSQPADMDATTFLMLWEELNELVHTLAVELGGSFSAEHGIGSLKVAELERLAWLAGAQHDAHETVAEFFANIAGDVKTGLIVLHHDVEQHHRGIRVLGGEGLRLGA